MRAFRPSDYAEVINGNTEKDIDGDVDDPAKEGRIATYGQRAAVHKPLFISEGEPQEEQEEP